MERVRSSAQSAEEKGQIHGRKEPLEIDITWEDIKEQFEKQGGYEYYLAKIGIKRKIDLDRIYNSYDQLSPSIDRIDSSKGYIKGNFVITFRYLNLGKGPISEDEFVKVLKYAHFGDNPNTINNKTSNIIGENKMFDINEANPLAVAMGTTFVKDNDRESYERLLSWNGSGNKSTSGKSTGTGRDTYSDTVARANERAQVVLDKAGHAKTLSDTSGYVSIREVGSKCYPSRDCVDYVQIMGSASGTELANGHEVHRADSFDISTVRSDLKTNRTTFIDNLYVSEDTADEIIDIVTKNRK